MQNVIKDLIQLTHETVKHSNMPMFFWNHLEKDIKTLEKALGKNEDDVCLLLHLVLKKIAFLETTDG